MRLLSLQLFSPDRSAALLSEPETERLLGPHPVRRLYGEPVKVTTESLQFAAGAGFLAKRTALRGVYEDLDDAVGDGSVRVVRWWRCRELTESVGDSDLVVRCVWRPLWLDAAETVARPGDVAVLGDAGTLDLALRLVDRPLADALAVVLDPANGAPALADGSPLLSVGVVEGDLVGGVVSFTASGATTLGAVEALAGNAPRADGIGAEYRVRVVEGASPALDTYAVDLFVPPDPNDASTVPVVTVDLRDLESNATRVSRTASDEGAVSVVVPVSSGAAEGETSGSIAGNRLAVASASGAALTLGAAVVWEPGALVGLTLQDLGTGETRAVTASEAPSTLTLDAAFPSTPQAVRLLSPDGGPLVALGSPALVGDLGRIERAVAFDVSPLANVLAEPGRTPEPVSADLSEWTDGDERPLGVYKIGETGALPTFARETDPGLIRYGAAGLRVVAPSDGSGARVDCGPYRADVGAWAGLHLVSGTVALRLSQRDPARGREVTVIEAEGSSQDDLVAFTELAVAVTADRFPAASDGGPEALTLDVVAKGGPAEFVLDALTLTAAPQAAPYAARMGPRALLEAAAAYLGGLVTNGASDTYEAEWFDLESLDGGDGRYLLPGDPVRLRVRLAAGEVTRDVRLLELSYVDAVGQAPVEIRGRFGRALPTLYDAVRGAAQSVTVRGASGSGSGGGVALDVPALPSAVASQPQGSDADRVVVEVGVPTGSGSGSSAFVSLTSDDGDAPRQTALVTAADFVAAAARGQSTVAVSFPVDRGGPFTVRSVPVRNGVEGPPTTSAVTVDASAPGTTSRSLPAVRGFKVIRGSQAYYARCAPWTDARVRALAWPVAWAEAEADLAGPYAQVVARPGVSSRRIATGPDTQLTYRPPVEHRNRVHQFFPPVPLASGTPGYVAATNPDAVLTDETGAWVEIPGGDGDGAPLLLP